MYSQYYADHEVFIENVRKLIRTELEPHLREWERKCRFPDSVFQTLGAQGYLGILVAEEQGGIGGDYALAGAWCESFGELCDVGLTIAVNMHSLVITPSIAEQGSAELKSKWLEAALAGEKIGAYAFTEPGCGSDLASLRTTAVKQGQKWVINGAKTFITNGARAHFVLVLTRTDPQAGYNGFTTFVVDTSAPGFKVNRTLDKLGWHSSDTAELTFDNVEVDASAILGQPGDGWALANRNLNWERLMLTLTTLGGMRACFRETLKYSRERKAFGKSIGEFGTIQDLLRRMYQKIVTSEVLLHRCLTLLQSKQPCRKEVSIAKRQVCDDALWLADRAIQIHGGYGYTAEFNPERWWRDLRLMPIGGGTSEIMAEIAAKEIFRT